MKKYIIVRDNAQYIAGTTLKVLEQPEGFNMGLHACKSKEAVMTNRKTFSQDLNIPLENCVFAHQTHSDHIYEVTAKDKGKGAFDYESAIADTKNFTVFIITFIIVKKFVLKVTKNAPTPAKTAIIIWLINNSIIT